MYQWCTKQYIKKIVNWKAKLSVLFFNEILIQNFKSEKLSVNLFHVSKYDYNFDK